MTVLFSKCSVQDVVALNFPDRTRTGQFRACTDSAFVVCPLLGCWFRYCLRIPRDDTDLITGNRSYKFMFLNTGNVLPLKVVFRVCAIRRGRLFITASKAVKGRAALSSTQPDNRPLLRPRHSVSGCSARDVRLAGKNPALGPLLRPFALLGFSRVLFSEKDIRPYLSRY